MYNTGNSALITLLVITPPMRYSGSRRIDWEEKDCVTVAGDES